MPTSFRSTSVQGVARFWVAPIALIALLFSAFSHAQAPAPAKPTTLATGNPNPANGPVSVPIRVVNGHILILCYIFSFDGNMESISLEVSLESPDTLALEMYGWLSMDQDKVDRGESVFVNLLFKPDIEIKIPGRDVKPEENMDRMMVHNDLTKFYSKFFDEHKVKGTLGRGFFSKYHTVLDIGAGVIRLSPLSGANEVAGDTVRQFEILNNRMAFDVNYAGSKTGKMILGSDNYDTLIDADLAKALGKPAGDVGTAFLNGANDSIEIDLSRYLAFRPKSFAKDTDTGKRGATFVSGINLLEHFKVEFDWANSKVGFTRAKNPQYPHADLDFFKAELTNSADEMQAHLDRHPKGRLAPEAAAKLMEWRLAEKNVSDDQMMRALQYVVDTSPSERQMENCTQYVRKFKEAGRSALAIRGGNLALSYSRTAMTVQDTYRLHNIIGEECLKENQINDAWKHFLSAAFMPLDDKTDFMHNVAVNVNLGVVYEKQGRAARAYSRYKKAEEKLRDKGILQWLDEMPKDEKAALDGGAKDLLVMVQDIRSALERLAKQIPAEDREMLDG